MAKSLIMGYGGGGVEEDEKTQLQQGRVALKDSSKEERGKAHAEALETWVRAIQCVKRLINYFQLINSMII